MGQDIERLAYTKKSRVERSTDRFSSGSKGKVWVCSSIHIEPSKIAIASGYRESQRNQDVRADHFAKCGADDGPGDGLCIVGQDLKFLTMIPSCATLKNQPFSVKLARAAS